MGQKLRVTVLATLGFVAFAGVAYAQSDPPGRIGRLAYINGTVSFHDDEQSQWVPATVNTPLTTGDSLWTEPNARSEVSISGTRVRMDGSTELDLLAVDDSQVRMQVPQGRLDIKAAAMDKPYEIVTPRGTVALQQQGDYYILAGSTQDPTRLGVRSGAAQITGLNGQTLAVRAGEVGEVSGDSGAPVLHTVQSAPPPMQPYWADRDRQVSYDAPQYLSASVTGYEDLNAYGGWSNDGTYGQVWTPRAVPVGWEPYRNGHWAYVQPWGWTWVDEQPWGFAPFHYGRWVNANNRWSWLPPARETPAVYAPALVSFIGVAAELALAANQPPSVGWFPLGPREVYVPPYTTNREYFRNVNRANVRDQALIDARYQWAEQHRDAQRPPPNDPRFTHVNQRFATVVPRQAFERSQPVQRVAMRVAPEKLAAAPIAPVAAPPIAVRNGEPARTQDGKPQARPEARTPDGKPQPENRANAANGPVARTALANMETIGKPTDGEKRNAPGPKFVKRADATPGAKPETGPAKANEAPPLVPRTGAAPPPLKGETSDNKARPGEPGRPEAPKPPAANDARGAPAPAERPALVKPEDSKTRPEPPKLPTADGKAAPPGGRPEAKPPAAAERPDGPKPPAAADKPEPPKPPAAAAKPEAPKPPAAAERPEPPKPPAATARPEAPKPPAAAERPEPPKPPAVENKAAPAPRPPDRPADARPPVQPERPTAVQRPSQAPQPPPQAAPAPQQAAPRPQPQPQAPPPQQAHAPEPPRQAPPPQAQAPRPQQGPAQKDDKK